MQATGQALELRDVPVPVLGPDDALVQTHSSGICGTDLHILSGHGYVPRLPHILGHEPCGVVVDVGRNVTSVRRGDYVVPHLFSNCGRCRYCQTGSQQQCTALQGILGVLCDGAFAEFFRFPAANLYVVPNSIPDDTAGLIADAVVTGIHATRRGGARLGDTAVVLGAGGVGQIIIQALSSAGVRVLAVDTSPRKLKLASQMGAALIAGAGEAAVHMAMQDTGGNGAEVVFNCVGTAQSMRAAADLVMRCGRIVVIGEMPEFPSIDTTEIAQRELEIIGSRNGTRKDMEDAIRLVATGTIRPYVDRRFPLDEINSAFDYVRNGSLGRVVVVVSGEVQN